MACRSGPSRTPSSYPLPIPDIVEAAILSALHRPPPRLVRPVPIDRALERVGEGVRRLPAGLAADLGGVERVTPVVSRAIGDAAHERVRLSHPAKDLSRELAVRPLV